MKSNPVELISIGDLAQRFGVATHVLRHWEAMGLLEPTERVNGRRRYGERDVSRVALIQRGKAAGLSLQQMAELIAEPDPGVRRDLLAKHRAELNRRVEELIASRTLLDHVLECRAPDFTTCPAFRKMMRELTAPVSLLRDQVRNTPDHENE
ncbi:MAG TPA: MerR family transcriptional regulator [Kineosporiaceae bacterium]|nr:MerR family transcriptional regulator [Kineosporiaceae bacterium]